MQDTPAPRPPGTGSRDAPASAGELPGHSAHADAWAELALTHAGGTVDQLPGARLASSGLPFPQYNGADVTDPALVDADAVGDWFAARGVPWAWRVPAGTGWSPGRLVVAQRLMAVRGGDLRSAPVPDGVDLVVAGPADLADVVGVDVEAFGGPPGQAAAWTAPHLTATRVTVGLARRGGRPVGTAYAVRSDGAAGPAVLLAGVAVVPSARRRGTGAALSSWLLAEAVAAGARLAHLQPDDDRAARGYARLGFREVPGLEVRAPSAGLGCRHRG